MRRVRAMLRALPRIIARHELATLPAKQIAAGNLKQGAAQRLYNDLRATARGAADRPRASGLEAFAAIRAMNARARERGELWEQLHPAGEVA